MDKKGQIHIQGEIFIDGMKSAISRKIRKEEYQNMYHNQNRDLDLKGTVIHVTTSQV